MSLMTMLLAFAPSAIATRLKSESDELAELRERCTLLQDDNKRLRERADFWRGEFQRTQAEVWRLRTPANPAFRQQQQAMAQYYHSIAMGAAQQQLATQQLAQHYCNCVPARSHSLLGAIGGV